MTRYVAGFGTINALLVTYCSVRLIMVQRIRRPLTMKKRDPKKKSPRPKRILRLPDLDHSKIAVLSTLSSPDSQRSYRFAIDDFISWYCSEPRLAFNKTVVLRYRLQLEARHLASSTINLRLAAVRTTGIRSGRYRPAEPRVGGWHPPRQGRKETRSKTWQLAQLRRG